MTDKTRLIKYVIAALIFLGTFIMYIKTLCPTVPPQDSGELITAAYTLLGKLFTFIPWGSIAWRVNLMSAFFASATVTPAYFFILGLTGSLTAAIAAPLLLAFTPFFWNLAVVAEVFQEKAIQLFWDTLLVQRIVLCSPGGLSLSRP